jgi:8-oxo-dGTP pyrophosphatase MutT (NUDIX family)
MSWRRRIEPWVKPLFFFWARLTRPMTLGVRAVVTDEDGRVLLVEHTYVHGWYLPGGGVDRGESVEQALRRELLEEAGVEVEGAPELIAIHASETFKDDHVALYRIHAWRQVEATSRGEIARTGFFAPDALPEGTTQANRRRIKEALGR